MLTIEVRIDVVTCSDFTQFFIFDILCRNCEY
jgi:hypothetical protein